MRSRSSTTTPGRCHRRTRSDSTQLRSFLLHLASERGLAGNTIFAYRRDLEIAIDFFAAPGRREAEAAVAALEEPAWGTPAGRASMAAGALRGKTWVTRRDVHVDRIASAWLIRRFVDAKAGIRFVAGRRHRPAEGEVRFDMFEGEFTHEGDRCTFEVLVDRLGLDDPALRALAEIVHDVDLKDGKFSRPEAPGVERLIDGITRAHATDEARVVRGAAALDDLYESFRVA